jgi:RimJ/RimL family protein N-acetyltransferase
MKLLPLDRRELFELAAGWMARKENHQWLDFGNGRQPFTPTLLKIMVQRDTHFMRVYTADRNDNPIGIVGLTQVDRAFRTAMLWGLCGDKSFRYRGYSSFAGSKLLTLAFRDLGLHVITTWAAEHNQSVRTLERLGFRFAGRLRQCHYIDGRPYDRLLFDLLASEHRELDGARWRRDEKSPRETIDAERSAQAA